jgi:Tol biopolymer transport system component
VSLTAGTRLGPYEILSPLGAGGMGEVYKAKDTRLERMVAVKVLPQHMASSPEVRQRFEREAKTISQLSHPHICALYDVGREGETEYLVMELLEGETLTDRLAKGALPLEQTLRYGTEIADALDKAHRQGIVHRDLKPGNVMITKSGVKLLDFGLAKAMAPSAQTSSLTALPTQQGLTQEGTILGTFQYMAPEQLEGKEADGRTDIFAFGAVLYEMATGKKAFSAVSQASLITAIMSAEPPAISAVQPMSPVVLDRVVKTCLAKDPEDRWQSASDLKRELRWIGEGSQSGVLAQPAAGARRRGGPGIAWSVALLCAAAALAATVILWRGRGASAGPSDTPLQLSLDLPTGEKLAIAAPNSSGVIRLSPDGRQLVYVLRSGATTELRLRNLETGETTTIPGTTGAWDPFFAPDGRWIGFTSVGALRKVALQGGTPFDIADKSIPRGAAWSADGKIYFTPGLYGGISRVSQEGGPVETVTELDKADAEKSHRWPMLLPGGKALVYAALTGRSWNEAQIVLKRLDTGERRVLIHGGTSPFYAPTGHLVFARAGSLYAVPLDLKRLEVTGQPVEVARDIFIESSGAAGAAFSPSGLLVYLPSSSVQSRRLLTRVDRSGAGAALSDRREAFGDPAISPDGSRVALQFNATIWIFDVSRRTFTQLTSGPRANRPIWTPDGKTIVYAYEKSGPWNVFARPADGSGAEQQLWPSPHMQVPSDVSPDGRSLLVQDGELLALRVATLPPVAGTDLRTVSGSGRPVDGRYSPDGRWIAYVDLGTARPEVFVVPASGGEGKWQISNDGGLSPHWSRSGKEIFYLNGENLMAVPVQTQPRFEPGVAVKLFSKPDLQYFDVEPDGEHFVLLESPEPSTRTTLGVVVNWFSRLPSQAAQAPAK